jgi:predicted MFS family arabinose efflux permease
MRNLAHLLPRAGIERRIVVGLALGQFVSWTVFYFSFSLFVAPLQREFGWSRVEINGALSLGLLVAGLCSLPIGRWIDRLGGRAIMSFGALGGGLLFCVWSYGTSLWILYLVWALMGFVLAAVLYEPAFTVITATTGQRFKQGITFVTLVAGFASTLSFPMTNWLIENLGWRHALVSLGLLGALIGFCVHWLVLADDEPGSAGGRTEFDASGPDPLREALRQPAFWLLMVCFVADGMVFASLTFHIIPLLGDRGVPIEAALGIVVLFGPAGVAGRALVLWLGLDEKIGTHGLWIVLLWPLAMMLLLVAGQSTALLLVYGLIYGIASGLMTILRGAAIGEFLGLRGYGAITGALMTPAKIAQASAPFLAAMGWQLAGGYAGVIFGLALLSTLGAVAFWLARFSAVRRVARFQSGALSHPAAGNRQHP